MDGTSDLGEDGDDPGLPDIASTACAGIHSYENVEISTDGGESDEDSSGELAENKCWIGSGAVALAHAYSALDDLEKNKLNKAIELVIHETLKVSEGFLSFESSARRAPSAFQACNRDTIKNKTLEALKNNTEHVETQPSVTLAAGRSGASFSLCLEQENASSSGGLVTENSSQIPEVIGGLHDLTLVLEEEARKDGTVGSLVHSILHEVIDEAVALHERERGPYGELGFMIPSSWLLEEAGLMWRIKREAGEDR